MRGWSGFFLSSCAVALLFGPPLRAQVVDDGQPPPVHDVDDIESLHEPNDALPPPDTLSSDTSENPTSTTPTSVDDATSANTPDPAATTDTASTDDGPTFIGDPPPPPPLPSPGIEIVDEPIPDDGERPLPPPDAPSGVRRQARAAPHAAPLPMLAGGFVGAVGGGLGASAAMTVAGMFLAMAITGVTYTTTSTNAGREVESGEVLAAGGLLIVGMTFAAITMVFSPFIAGIAAAAAMLALVVEPEEGDWAQLGVCAGGILAATLAILAVFLIAISGGGSCGSPGCGNVSDGGPSFYDAARPAISGTITGVAIGGMLGPIVLSALAFSAASVIEPALLGGNTPNVGAVSAVPVVVAAAIPFGVVVGSMVGGGVGGALSMAYDVPIRDLE